MSVPLSSPFVSCSDLPESKKGSIDPKDGKTVYGGNGFWVLLPSGLEISP